MRELSHPVWLLCVAAFALHQLAGRMFGLDLGAVDDYLDPFLCAPILLGLLVTERRILFSRPAHYRLSALEVGAVTLVLALISEELFPRWSAAFTRDGWDYLAYAAGGLLYYFTVGMGGPGRHS